MNMKVKVLEKHCSSAIGRPENEAYFKGDAALFIPPDCDSGDVAIIGIETFTITSGGTFPHMDGIFDRSPRAQEPWTRESWDEFRQACNLDALAFTQEMCTKKGTCTYFTFVFFDSDDYARCFF